MSLAATIRRVGRCVGSWQRGNRTLTNWLVPEGRSSGLELAVGHAALWHEPGEPTFHQDQPHAFATREVTAAPTVKELGSGAENEPWRFMRQVSLGVLANGALLPGCAAFEVRYVVAPRGAGDAAVRMFVTAKSRDWHQEVAQAAVAGACDRLPAGFTWSTPAQELGFGREAPPDSVVLELRRDEDLTAPEWDYIPADFYYVINDDPGDGSGWSAFWRTLTSVSRPITVSFLFHQTELHWEERQVLGAITTDLSRFSQQRTEYDVFYNPVVYPPCMNAKFALESWEQRIQKLRRPVLARLAVRGDVATAATVATALATAVGTQSTGAASHPMYVDAPRTRADNRQADFGFDWLEILPWGGHGIWEDSAAPMSLRRMPYLFGLEDAASLLVLPVPDDQGVAGIALSRKAATRRETFGEELDHHGLQLGVALHEGSAGHGVSLPLTAVNRHALVVGAPGSGKTTTVMSLLAQLWLDHQVPFLVIESVKAEYRSLLEIAGFEDLQVLTLGNEQVGPLRLNPLAPPQGVRCEVHMGSVLASLKMALPLFPPLPQILSTAIGRCYYDAGWDDETTMADGVAPPTLRNLMTAFDAVFAELGYQGEARDIGRAFHARLSSLIQGSRGKVLDTVPSTNFSALLGKPVVVEMHDVNDPDEKAVMAAFLLDRVRAEAKRRGSAGGVLKHVTVIEEAHRLLSAASAGAGDAASGNQARSDSVRAFCEAIAELRSMGEGFIMSTQSPTLLAEAAVANSGTRILHRMESSADRKLMLDDLDANDRVREFAARLRRGEAVVRWPERDEIELVQVNPLHSVDSARAMSDELVANRMAEHRLEVTRLLPFPMCTSEMCPEGCHSRIRRQGEGVAEATRDAATELWRNAGTTGRDPVLPIADVLCARSPGNPQVAYCAAAHLSVLGAALRVRPNVDDRPALVKAIRRSSAG